MEVLKNGDNEWREMDETDKDVGAAEETTYELAGGILVAQDVVDHFYERLVRLARKKMAVLPPQVADEEGAVVSALRSFFSGVQDGQFHDIENQNDLWRLLATITARKSIRQIRVHWKQAGEANRVIRASDIQQLAPVEPSVEEELMIMEEFDRLIEGFQDETLKRIICLRLEGFESPEIATQLGIHVRSVQRKIKMVKSKWLETLNEE